MSRVPIRLPRKRKQTPEGSLKTAVEELLNVERIPYWRMNAGDRFGSTNGRKWRIRGHAKGTADLLAAPCILTWKSPQSAGWVPQFLWLELKAPDGKPPTPEQLEFADAVRNRGHYHLFVTNVRQVQDWLKENSAR